MFAKLPIKYHLVNRLEFNLADTAEFAADANFLVTNGAIVSLGSLTVVAHGDQKADGSFVGDWGQPTNVYEATVFGNTAAGTGAVGVGTVVYDDVPGGELNLDSTNGTRLGVVVSGSVAAGQSGAVLVALM